MFELTGKYGTAKVFADIADDKAISQIIELMNQDFVVDAQVRIMPDCHAGAGCVIGFTADLGDKVIPNIVGVDIGCGMLTVEIPGEIDLKKLDEVIHETIPSGRHIHEEVITNFSIDDLLCLRKLRNPHLFLNALGSLGGGNHFIEVGKRWTDMNYLVIHSGSRNLGKQVADYYQQRAIKNMGFDGGRDRLIASLKAQGREQEISKALKNLSNKSNKYPKHLSFLSGMDRSEYLHDMNICQEFASVNRLAMAALILNGLGLNPLNMYKTFETIHNYVNFEDNIIRKGAISAQLGELVLIPINMRDGSIIAVGKGNPDWNNSAPHGAGRLMSRSEAKKLLSMEEYEDQMSGIYTTSVSTATLDEAPMAYKPIDSILENIKDTVEVIDRLTPIYNFKASN